MSEMNDEWVTAIHEGAHARIGVLYGLDAEARIEDPSTGLSGSTRFRAPGTPFRYEADRRSPSPRRNETFELSAEVKRLIDEYLFGDAVRSLAGIEGEKFAFPELAEETILNDGDLDIADAREAIVQMSDAERRYMAHLARAEAVARKLVREHFASITLIAVALLRERHLRPERISAIIAEAERDERSGEAA